jgi:hypothetical protein
MNGRSRITADVEVPAVSSEAPVKLEKTRLMHTRAPVVVNVVSSTKRRWLESEENMTVPN